MTSLDVFAFGAGLGVAAEIVYRAACRPPSAFEAWCWRAFEGRA